MAHHTIYKRVLLFLITICMFYMQSFSVRALENQQERVVKVAVLNHTTYAYQDDQGTWRGMDVECMIAVAQKEGFQVEFIDSSDDADFMAHLDDGTYDIAADIVKTEERSEKYLFTDTPIGNYNNTIYVRADDVRWDYGNVTQVSSMKVGVIESYSINNAFRQWCNEHEVTPQIVTYATSNEVIAAAKNGDVDGMIMSTSLDDADRDSFRTIMKILPDSYYFAFRKSDVELKNMVDEGLGLILSANVDFLTNLKTKYETQFEVNALPFSAKENTYLQEHPILHIAVVKDDDPYYANRKGKATGILPDYYALLAKEMGCDFVYDEYADNEQVADAVASGKSDIAGIFSSGMISAYQNGITISDPYATVTNILLTKSGVDADSIQSIAIKDRPSAIIEQGIKTIYPDVNIQRFATAEECFAAMQDGRTDAAMMGMPSATYEINQTNSTQYNVIPMSDILLELCSGVKADNQILCSILNKSISRTKSQFNGISTKNTLPENTVKSLISRIPSSIILLTGGIMTVLIIGLVWSMLVLHRRQVERTAILNQQAEMKVQKAQIDAMRQNAEERNQFFANISHDMRTPLNAITGFIRLAQNDSLSSEQRNAYLKKADTSSGLLLDLINDTLTVSKMSSGKLKLHPVPCQIQELQQAIVTSIKAEAEKRKIHFHMEGTTGNEYVLVDKLNFEKIFLNLLSNAVKYTHENGNVWFRVSQGEQTENQIDYTFVVRDDGIGISDQFQKFIFEPFSQEKRTGYESQGTGLGLSIVKNLVDLMGGTIALESNVNEGSTFTVRLSLAKTEAPEATGEIPVLNMHTLLVDKHVLLCEDNALNREIALSLLKEKGMITDCAEDGAIGVERFKQSPEGYYDLILMDIRMPHLNGYQATEKVRHLDRKDAKTVPIIAMSADAFADDIQKCMDAGMNGHIGKPIDTKVFTKTIQKAIDEAKSSRGA